MIIFGGQNTDDVLVVENQETGSPYNNFSVAI